MMFNFLNPVLSQDNLEVTSCRLFRSKFQLLSRHDIVLSEALTSDPVHSKLLERVSASSALKDKILSRSTALQVLLFTCWEQSGNLLEEDLWDFSNWALGNSVGHLID